MGLPKVDHLQPVNLILSQTFATSQPFILGAPTSHYPRDSGISALLAFKVDHLQPVKLILSQQFSTFLPFILGGPIPYYPRERKKGSSSGRKWGKGNHPKVNETQGFLYLGHSNWTICSLLSWFCSKNCPTIWLSYWEFQLSVTPERGKWEKGIHPKVDETQGFLYLGHSNWTICSLLSWFCSLNFPPFLLSYWGEFRIRERPVAQGVLRPVASEYETRLRQTKYLAVMYDECRFQKC